MHTFKHTAVRSDHVPNCFLKFFFFHSTLEADLKILRWILWSQAVRRCGPDRVCGWRGKSSVHTEDAQNNPHVVLFTLMVWKMLYCTFARGHSAATLSCNVYCTLWYLCTGKVKYIYRVDFGFYANCWCFFPVIKSNKYKNDKWICPDSLWFIVGIFHSCVSWAVKADNRVHNHR